VATAGAIAAGAMIEHAGEFGDMIDDDFDGEDGTTVSVAPPAPADQTAAAQAAQAAATDSAAPR